MLNSGACQEEIVENVPVLCMRFRQATKMPRGEIIQKTSDDDGNSEKLSFSD